MVCLQNLTDVILFFYKYDVGVHDMANVQPKFMIQMLFEWHKYLLDAMLR